MTIITNYIINPILKIIEIFDRLFEGNNELPVTINVDKYNDSDSENHFDLDEEYNNEFTDLFNNNIYTINNSNNVRTVLLTNNENEDDYDNYNVINEAHIEARY